MSHAILKGGQTRAFLAELLAVLDAMPVKELGGHVLLDSDGECCALGAVCIARGIHEDDLLDVEDTTTTAKLLGIHHAIVRFVTGENDKGGEDGYGCDRQARRWKRMREWTAAQLPEVSP